jgi:ACT domain-containing protein
MPVSEMRVEGATGTSREGFGLDLIMCVLEATSKTEATLIILEKNAIRRILLKIIELFHYKEFITFFD